MPHALELLLPHTIARTITYSISTCEALYEKEQKKALFSECGRLGKIILCSLVYG
jgi:hypothetical protein